MPGGNIGRPNARITRRLAARPRARRKRRLRYLRGHIQLLAAIGTVLAGLMSVPAIVISLHSLQMTERQQQESLARQRKEDQKKARAEAEAAEREQTGFFTRVTTWAGGDGRGANWYVRNANSRPAEVIIRLTFRHEGTDGARVVKPAAFYELRVGPCSQGHFVIRHPHPDSYNLVLKDDLYVIDEEGAAYDMGGAPVDFVTTVNRLAVREKASLEGKPRSVLPCT